MIVQVYTYKISVDLTSGSHEPEKVIHIDAITYLHAITKARQDHPFATFTLLDVTKLPCEVCCD